MISPGDALTNPITGETLIFHRTAAETAGESVLVETIVHPDGFVAAAHVHPSQTERFEILDGLVELNVGHTTHIAEPGDVVLVPAGTAHRFRNAGDADARFLCEIRPALQFESLIETMFTLANKGKTNDKGLPNLLRLAVIADAHFDTVRLPFPPALLQRTALTASAPVGRLLGYQPSTARPAADKRPHARARRTYDRGRPHEQSRRTSDVGRDPRMDY